MIEIGIAYIIVLLLVIRFVAAATGKPTLKQEDEEKE